LDVFWLEIDEEVEKHIDRHGIQGAELIEILSNRHLTFPNRDEGQGRIYLLGKTDAGRLIKVSLAPTDDSGTWRPVTAFPATASDTKLFARYVR
jgi:hypothetical protein